MDNVMEIMNMFVDTLNDSDSSNDVWGMMYDSRVTRANLTGAGVTLLKTNRNNHIITVVANTSTNVTIAAKMAELVNHEAMDYYVSAMPRRRDMTLFTTGNALMLATCLYNGQKLKLTEGLDYGILVLPKYSEADEYGCSAYGASPFAIPATALDAHASAVIIDTMNWLANTEDEGGMGEDRLVYTYYNTVLKGQVSNSPQDNEMLDLARSTQIYEFDALLRTTGLSDGFVSAIEKNTSVSVTMDNMVGTAQKALTDSMEFYNPENPLIFWKRPITVASFLTAKSHRHMCRWLSPFMLRRKDRKRKNRDIPQDPIGNDGRGEGDRHPRRHAKKRKHIPLKYKSNIYL